MIKSVEYAEHRATIPAEVGFECTFYEGLFCRTAPLRKSLYVAAAVPDGVFRPGLMEHFPKQELVSYMLRNGMEAYGKGEAVEVAFRCYSPAGSGSAEEGARIIGEALEALRDRLTLDEGTRSKAAMREGLRSAAEHLSLNMGEPYRPPLRALGERRAPPDRPARGPAIGEAIRGLFRGELERWGVLEDYDRLRAESFRPVARPKARPAPEVFVPWTPPPEPDGLERWRIFEEQQKAMNERYGRMGGGSW